MPHTDTSPAAQALHSEILRAMSGEQWLLLAFEMSLFARELAREGIRRQHPEWPEARVAPELLRLAFFSIAPSLLNPLSVSEVLRRVTSALDRAGIAYMLTGSFCRRPPRRCALNPGH
jgi:hypothetical protein